MNILGIETSCDETTAAVVQNGTKLLSNVIVSQIDIHKEFGGVVPEVAARSHIEVILPTIEKALTNAFLQGGSLQKVDTKANYSQSPSTDYRLPSTPFDPWDQIDGIAVTHGPGLLGSLLIGTLTARTLALLKNKPLYPINHVEGHTYANFLTELGGNMQKAISNKGATKFILPSTKPRFPLLSLTVSGGHSQLVLSEDHGRYRLLGQTQDDAVGEAFDKVAKMLGIGYPGGPAIAKAAEVGNPHAYEFPNAKFTCSHSGAHYGRSGKAAASSGLSGTQKYREEATQLTTQSEPQKECRYYDFSFSGLKTAVLRHLQRLIGEDYNFRSFEIAARLTKQQINDTAASFQRTAVETMVAKTLAAFRQLVPRTVVIAGGVAANQELRRQLKAVLPVEIQYAPPILCTDNAAMIAARGYFSAQAGKAADPLKLEVVPSLTM